MHVSLLLHSSCLCVGSVTSAPPEVPAADAVVCPAPAKRPRLDSARLPEPEPEPEPEPGDPDDPADPDDPLSLEPAPAPKQHKKRVKKDQNDQKDQKDKRDHKERDPPPSPPLSTVGEGDGEGDSPPPLFSEEDLFLRKRFNTPR